MKFYISPLFYAIERGNNEIVKLLLTSPNVNPNIMTSYLYWINQTKDSIIDKSKRKANKDESIIYEISPFLLQQIENGICSLCEIFLTILSHFIFNICISFDLIFYESPLTLAIKMNNDEIIKNLLEVQSINVNIKNYERVIKKKSEDDENLEEKNEITALEIAVDNCNIFIISFKKK